MNITRHALHQDTVTIARLEVQDQVKKLTLLKCLPTVVSHNYLSIPGSRAGGNKCAAMVLINLFAASEFPGLLVGPPIAD
ncbi:hypothetical protein ES703_124749 [subsurface metagenome]